MKSVRLLVALEVGRAPLSHRGDSFDDVISLEAASLLLGFEAELVLERAVEAPLEGVRFIVFEGPPGQAPLLVLGENRIPAWWGPPAFHNAGLEIYDLAPQAP